MDTKKQNDLVICHLATMWNKEFISLNVNIIFCSSFIWLLGNHFKSSLIRRTHLTISKSDLEALVGFLNFIIHGNTFKFSWKVIIALLRIKKTYGTQCIVLYTIQSIITETLSLLESDMVSEILQIKTVA